MAFSARTDHNLFGIAIDANRNITAAKINALSTAATGGEIGLRAQDTIATSGDIITNQNNLTFNGNVNLANNVNFAVAQAGGIFFNGTVDGSHTLNLQTDNGTIQFNGIVGGATPLNSLSVRGNTTSINSESGVNITTSNNILTENIISPTGISLRSNNRQIDTGILDTSALRDAGDVRLNAAGNISASSINAQSRNGVGGNVEIETPSYVQIRNTFKDRNGINASISVAGGEEGGTSIIRHGGNGKVPFVVGNATTNGTAGAITRGHENVLQTISPTENYWLTHKQDLDRLQIISIPGNPIPPDAIPFAQPVRAFDFSQGRDPRVALAYLIGDTLAAQTYAYIDFNTGDFKFGWYLDDTAIASLNVPSFMPVSEIDKALEEDYEQYFKRNITNEIVTVEMIQETLKKIESETKTRAVIIYALPSELDLRLVLVRPEDDPLEVTVPGAKSQSLERQLSELQLALMNPKNETYLPHSQQLYQWLIAPLEPQLNELNLNTLIFAFGGGLRSLPLAALHDGERFLVEKYSLGSIPSVSLTDTGYQGLKESRILGMGTVNSPDSSLPPLPAVPVELSAIANTLGRGEVFLDQQFTLQNLQTQRNQNSFDVIHLATHASFVPDSYQSPFIQFWDNKVSTDELRKVGWNSGRPVELLALSACETAIGDLRTEMGFAGLAVQAGVKSALASLWKVNDVGTLPLMSGFYEQLSREEVKIKAEALRQSQLALLRGDVRVESGRLLSPTGELVLPPDFPNAEEYNLSHPYFWAGFTLIGSPW